MPKVRRLSKMEQQASTVKAYAGGFSPAIVAVVAAMRLKFENYGNLPAGLRKMKFTPDLEPNSGDQTSNRQSCAFWSERARIDLTAFCSSGLETNALP